eukprot:6846570-Pyramimonas_sp.AAC.1
MIEERVRGPCRGWVPTVWRLRAGNLVVISAYSCRSTGAGASISNGFSQSVLGSMSSDPWMIVADWNSRRMFSRATRFSKVSDARFSTQMSRLPVTKVRNPR